MDEMIDLNGLVPDFMTFSFPPDSPEQLSVLFVTGLLGLFGLFGLWSLFITLRAALKIRWLRTLLSAEREDTTVDNRLDLLEKAEKKGGAEGHLWLEFDETLIEVKHHDQVRLFNTLDAEHFFNGRTLAAAVTDSRLLAAVPGFLTAVGVIGTFTGLQLGLSELNIGNEVAVSEMKTGLAHVISGAKIAFITSVWGVSLSFLFNFMEKFFERFIRLRISQLQRRIDQLFPRLSAEYQLQQIVSDGRQSRESLQGLAEKIGEKMQESLLEVSSGIQQGLESSLEKIMAPAINQLVNETTDGNQKALESLVETFMSRFGEQGQRQRDAMEHASQKVNDALSALSGSMTGFLHKLEESQGKSAEREQDLIEKISVQVSQLVSQSEEHGKKLSEYVETQLGQLSDSFQEQQRSALDRDRERQSVFIEQTKAMRVGTEEMAKRSEEQLNNLSERLDARDRIQSEREQQRQETFNQQSNEIKESTETLLESIEKSVAVQAQSAREILNQGKVLQEGIDRSIQANVDASVEMKNSAAELKSSSQSMQMFGAHIQNAGDQLSGAVNEAVQSTTGLARANQQFKDLIDQQKQQLVKGQEQFSNAIDQLTRLMNSADGTFDTMREHQDSFLQDLSDKVAGLARQMTALLQDYAEKANSQTATHLDLWAKHSYDYADKMNTAVNAISSVVDDIEGKLRN